MDASTPVAKEVQNLSLGVRDLDSSLQGPALAEHDHEHSEPGEEETSQIKTMSLLHEQAMRTVMDGNPINKEKIERSISVLA